MTVLCDAFYPPFEIGNWLVITNKEECDKHVLMSRLYLNPALMDEWYQNDDRLSELKRL